MPLNAEEWERAENLEEAEVSGEDADLRQSVCLTLRPVSIRAREGVDLTALR